MGCKKETLILWGNPISVRLAWGELKESVSSTHLKHGFLGGERALRGRVHLRRIT